jgi:hypothetical protein
MKTNFKLLTAIFSIALLSVGFFACKKDTTSSAIVPTATNNFNTLFGALKSPTQTYGLQAGTYSQVNGLRGTRLLFYPNSFKDANGNLVTTGNIQIQLIEMYKPGEMIANRAMTTSNGSPLISGGQVYIKATLNGVELKAGKFGIGFKQTTASTQPMNIYYGNRNNPDSIVTWSEPVTSIPPTNGTQFVQDSSNSGYFHLFDSCTSFNFINCDYFGGSTSPLTSINAIMPDTSFNNNNTQIFLVITSINSCTYSSSYSNATPGTFTTSNIPIGLNIHIVGITNKSGTYYYSEYKNLTTTSNMTQTMSFTQKTLADIGISLSNL